MTPERWVQIRRIFDAAVERPARDRAAYLRAVCAQDGQVRKEVESLLASPAVRVIPQSRESFLAGLQLYRARPDEGYSLTDCISMRTMQRLGLTAVLTNDRHFEQEGFRAIFREI